jgi:hypothetical protein
MAFNRSLSQKRYEKSPKGRATHVVWRNVNIERLQAAERERRRKRVELVQNAKRKPCADCGNSYPPCAMDFDHRNPKEKKFGICQAKCGNRSLKTLQEEIDKCDVVCATCHRIRHGDSDDSM